MKLHLRVCDSSGLRERRTFSHTSIDSEVLRLSFSSHDVEIAGRNLRPLLLAVQDFAVKWIRAIPARYHALADSKNGVVVSIRVEEAK